MWSTIAFLSIERDETEKTDFKEIIYIYKFASIKAGSVLLQLTCCVSYFRCWHTNIPYLEIRLKSSIFWLSYQPHSSLADWARELFKPLTLRRPAKKGDFRKKHWNARGFAWELLCSCMGYGPGWSVKRSSKSSSWHSKKFFLVGGCGFFVSDIISGGLLGSLGPLYLALGANR